MSHSARDDIYRLATLLAELERIMDPLTEGEGTDYRVDPTMPPPLPPTGSAGGGGLGSGSGAAARSAHEWGRLGRDPRRHGISHRSSTVQAEPLADLSSQGLAQQADLSSITEATATSSSRPAKRDQSSASPAVPPMGRVSPRQKTRSANDTDGAMRPASIAGSTAEKHSSNLETGHPSDAPTGSPSGPRFPAGGRVPVARPEGRGHMADRTNALSSMTMGGGESVASPGHKHVTDSPLQMSHTLGLAGTVPGLPRPAEAALYTAPSTMSQHRTQQTRRGEHLDRHDSAVSMPGSPLSDVLAGEEATVEPKASKLSEGAVKDRLADNHDPEISESLSADSGRVTVPADAPRRPPGLAIDAVFAAHASGWSPTTTPSPLGIPQASSNDRLIAYPRQMTDRPEASGLIDIRIPSPHSAFIDRQRPPGTEDTLDYPVDGGVGDEWEGTHNTQPLLTAAGRPEYDEEAQTWFTETRDFDPRLLPDRSRGLDAMSRREIAHRLRRRFLDRSLRRIL